ncbi:MAG: PAC2 family protein [Dactylosporangium sp.]|nr:PAC2 family protein [Dactylosporangium sp.]NNJ60213.1 PAC2 family protein [Dactylosporangium sp.]
MLDPRSLYEFAEGLPTLDRPVLVQALTGFVDAGHVGRIALDHLVADTESHTIAVFDIDQLFDYRTRRPAMVFHTDRWEHYEAPRLALRVLHDAGGTPYLLLSGPEPDLQWERFVEAVITIVERLGVRLTIGLNAIPMAVPHTRPIGVTAHATHQDLIEGNEPWAQRIQVPGSVGNLLEYRLGQRGRDALGFVVHVPHYLAQSEYPAAAERVLRSIAESSGLVLPVDALHAASSMVNTKVDQQVAQAEEATTLVRALEQQYDAQTHQAPPSASAAPVAGPLPTADELAAELERFLAEQPDPGDAPAS